MEVISKRAGEFHGDYRYTMNTTDQGPRGDDLTRIVAEKIERLSLLIARDLSLVSSFLEKGTYGQVRTARARKTKIQELEDEIEEECIRVLALEKGRPFVINWVAGAVKIMAFLEGARQQILLAMENTTLLKSYGQSPFHRDILCMARLARRMLKESVKSFLGMDIRIARKVLEEDPELDRLKETLFEKATDFMVDHPQKLHETVRWLLVSKNLERVGDQASHIAEEVMFLAREDADL